MAGDARIAGGVAGDSKGRFDSEEAVPGEAIGMSKAEADDVFRDDAVPFVGLADTVTDAGSRDAGAESGMSIAVVDEFALNGIQESRVTVAV